jgi:cytochrome P450
MPPAGATQILQGLFTPQGIDDPYPLYARLHERGEVFPAGGAVFVAGYEAVGAVLRDPAFLVHGAAGMEKAFPDWRQHPSLSAGSLLSLDGADHSRVRGLLSRAFSRRRVAGLAPAVSQITSRLLQDMALHGAAGEPVEFMDDFAYLLPATVIGELLGVPESDRGTFRPLAQARVAGTTDEGTLPADRLAAADTAARTLNDYFAQLAAERRSRPRDDLISVLVTASEPAGGRLSQSELLDNLNTLLLAGFLTTSNLLGPGSRRFRAAFSRRPKAGGRARGPRRDAGL